MRCGSARRSASSPSTWRTTAARGRLLLIAGGVGMTPIVSVLAAAADAAYAGPITLLASFRSEVEILFRDEIEAFRTRLPGLHVSIFVTAQDGALQGPRGRIDVETLRPHAESLARVHLCGPAPMMQAMIGALTDLRVPRDAIHTEAFRVEPEPEDARRERADGRPRRQRGRHPGLQDRRARRCGVHLSARADHPRRRQRRRRCVPAVMRRRRLRHLPGARALRRFYDRRSGPCSPPRKSPPAGF